MKEKILEIIEKNPGALVYASEKDKESHIEHLASAFEVRDGRYVEKQTSTAFNLEDAVFGSARQFVKQKTLADFVPQFKDRRPDDVKRADEGRAFNYFKSYLEKAGIVFPDDETEQTTVDKLSKNFQVFNENGKVVLRKFENGMYSTDFDPEKVIAAHVREHDVEESNFKRKVNFGNHLQAALRTYGFSGLNGLDKGERKKVENLAKEFQDRAFKGDARKLPVSVTPSQSSYQDQFRSQALHELGVSDLRMLPLQQQTKVRGHVESRLKKLNDLNRISDE